MNLHAMHTSINFLRCDLESPNYIFITKSQNSKFQTKTTYSRLTHFILTNEFTCNAYQY
jgi:hypothetical protein